MEVQRETKLQSQTGARLLLVEKMGNLVLAYGDYSISIQRSRARNEWQGKKILSQPLSDGQGLVMRFSHELLNFNLRSCEVVTES